MRAESRRFGQLPSTFAVVALASIAAACATGPGPTPIVVYVTPAPTTVPAVVTLPPLVPDSSAAGAVSPAAGSGGPEVPPFAASSSTPALTPSPTPVPTLRPTIDRFQQTGSHGWLGTGGDDVVFLQLTVAGNVIEGTLSWDFAEPGTYQVQEAFATTSGLLSGTSATLTVSPPVRGAQAMTARLNGSRMELTYPSAAGTLRTMLLDERTPDDYNVALAELRTREGQAATAAQTAAARASCSIGVSGHDATILVTGRDVGPACDQLAATVGLPFVDSWGRAQHPAQLPRGDTVVCSGNRSGFTVEVVDSGGRFYAGIICRALFP